MVFGSHIMMLKHFCYGRKEEDFKIKFVAYLSYVIFQAVEKVRIGKDEVSFHQGLMVLMYKEVTIA